MPSSENINITFVQRNSLLGRFLIASKATKANELLIEEFPIALGPKTNGPVVCLQCFKPQTNEELCLCGSCGWPLCVVCSENTSTYHAKWECSVFRNAKARFYSIPNNTSCPQLDCVTPLRVLLAKEADPYRWDREVAPMEHHEKARRANDDVWHADRVNIAQYLRGPCKLADQFSEDLIMKVVGLLEVNAFEARTNAGYPLRCLYPITGILAHSCVPNTARTIHPSEGFKIRLRAMRDLEAGAQLQHAYTYTLTGTRQRQAHLKSGKFFTCSCERCQDPTELGTHFSTLKCSKCFDGMILLMKNDLDDENVSWKCQNCNYVTTDDAVEKILAKIQSDVAIVQALDLSPKRLEQSEQLIRRYQTVLHAKHFIMISLSQDLIEMYGRVQGYEMVQLSDEFLERKAKLCRQVLSVLNIFEPGLSRARATNLYELHVPLVLLAKSGFIAGMLNGEDLKERLLEAITILEECVSILQYEDQTSQEGALCKVARQALEQLSISVVGLGGNN